MTREEKRGLPVLGTQAKKRHEKFLRAQNHDARVWRQLNPLKQPAKLKHKSYFESVENADKKKKLETQITEKREPYPGFEFVPTGHPELTTMCKELSREKECCIYIVSDCKDTGSLYHHLHRAGYQFRQYIVEQARQILRREGINDDSKLAKSNHPESIPKSQAEIDKQADAVLRDLFPRIPNTDRMEIIQHAFEKNTRSKRVGMAEELPLARRVQLAALAHIRHTRTRYDELLKETDWANARKAVEMPCLDVIVKWRGDEETGRDQLDEILREVIEISDDEDESDEGISSEEAMSVISRPTRAKFASRDVSIGQDLAWDVQPSVAQLDTYRRHPSANANGFFLQAQMTKTQKRNLRKTQQRFRRYAAAAEAQANEPGTLGVHVNGSGGPLASFAMDRTPSMQELYLPGLTQDRSSSMAYMPRPVPVHEHHQSPFANPMRRNPKEERTINLSLAPTQANIPARGQSPVLVRAGNGNVPKVGLPTGYHRFDENPLLPVRQGLQDMLLPSIEPPSPNGLQQPYYSSQLPHSSQQFVDVPRIVSRTIIHEPIGSADRPRSPGFVVIRDENTSKHRRVTDQYPHDSAAPTNVGPDCTGRHREGDRRFAPFHYLSEHPVEQLVETPEGFARHRVIYVEDPPNRSLEDVVSRTRTNPILIETPRRVDDKRGPPGPVEYERMPARRFEAARDAPHQDDRRDPNGPRVIYLNEPAPRPNEYRGNTSNGLRPQDIRFYGVQPLAQLYEQGSHVVSVPRLDYEGLYGDIRQALNADYQPVGLPGNQGQGIVHHEVHYENTRRDLPSYPDQTQSQAETHYSDQHLPTNRPLPEHQPYYRGPIQQLSIHPNNTYSLPCQHSSRYPAHQDLPIYG